MLRLRRELMVGCMLLLPTGIVAAQSPGRPALPAVADVSEERDPKSEMKKCDFKTVEPDQGVSVLAANRALEQSSKDSKDLDQVCVAGGSGAPSVAGTGVRTADAGESVPVQPGKVLLKEFAALLGGAPSFAPSGPSSASRAACFLRGTRIKTPSGERNIEELRIGDLITTPSGAWPVKFVWRQVFHASPDGVWSEHVLPITIAQGAFGQGLPHRALSLSPLHGVYMDGALIRARDLVNGDSIVQHERASDEIEYFNVELDNHNIMFANGVAVETFRAGHALIREDFTNFAEYASLYPADAYRCHAPYAPRLRTESFMERVLGALQVASRHS
jgi:hypothetical protein